jgi:hypothetical protein
LFLEGVFEMRLFSHSPRPATKTAHLHLERLEERAVPTAGFNQTFVALSYHTLLRRDADPGALRYWSAIADAQGRDAVVRGIQDSPEHQFLRLRDLYTSILGRPASEAELNYYLAQEQAGRQFDQIEAGFYGSDEFFSRVGRTTEGLLNAVYQNELGRRIDDAALHYLQGQLAAGVPAGQVALALLDSDEAVEHDVRDVYTHILGRPASETEAGYWLATERHGRGRDDVIEVMLSSAEDRDKIQATVNSPPRGVNTDDPNALAQAVEDRFHISDDRQGHGRGGPGH